MSNAMSKRQMRSVETVSPPSGACKEFDWARLHRHWGHTTTPTGYQVLLDTSKKTINGINENEKGYQGGYEKGSQGGYEKGYEGEKGFQGG
jgi:hypothetical protein